MREIENRGIEIPASGGNEWSHEADKGKGLDAYVHLSFCTTHPMLFIAQEDGRITNPVWLRINTSVLFEPSVRFSSDVSNKSGVEIYDLEMAKNKIDFEILFTYMDWRDADIQKRRQAAEKSEILVPNIVPIDKIVGY